MLPLRLDQRRLSRLACLGIVLLGVQACDMNPQGSTSDAPDRAWAPNGAAATDGNFGVSGDVTVGNLPEGVQSGRALGLPELIDIAQRNNPSTRLSWESARQAAISAKMVEGTYLPIITANIIGGRQEIVTPVTNLQGEKEYLDTTVTGMAPNVALQWLLFDFGERQAWRDAAGQSLYAANVTFNGTHQALIYNVTRSYYMYSSAVTNLDIAKQAQSNSARILDAAEARFRNGTGTSIEVAQARQLAAQSKLRVVQGEDGLRDAYQDLLGAMGISPRSEVRIATVTDRKLPRGSALPTDDVIKAALARRPDVLASYAAIKASEASGRAADAAFRPKIYAGAVAGPNQVGLQTGNLSGVTGQSTTAGVLIGVAVPLYDGSIRINQRRKAQSAIAEAEAAFEQTRNAAMREIVVASDTLRSALEAYAAADALVNAAMETYDAAFDAYRNGVGTITDATAAENGLLDARQARSDAHTSSLVAASTLAFSLGSMTSRDAPARAIVGRY